MSDVRSHDSAGVSFSALGFQIRKAWFRVCNGDNRPEGLRILEGGEDLYAVTHPGWHRERNEDEFYVDPKRRLLVAADGMGGQKAGQIASRLVVNAIAEIAELTAGSGEARLRRAFTEAQDRVVRGQDREDWAGMASAAIAGWIEDDVVTIMHAGDVRGYLFRGGVLRRLTFDHSYVGRLVAKGEIGWEEARLHPRRNEIWQAIGLQGGLEPDVTSVKLQPHDLLLLCSDGLWEELADAEIEESLKARREMKTLGARLLNGALESGGHDNITLILYRHSQRRSGNSQ